jgi:hypothetical protein
MPAKLLLSLTLIGLVVRTTRAEDFPYTAYVCTESAEIVAGPGHRFYATDRLPRGTKVEIYREDSAGWLAIRPPEGSFSWTPAEFIERLSDENLAKVKEPTGAWVGTTVEHVAEHHQQVTLKAGELVQVLGEKKVSGKDREPRTWLKVAPPAGEYRWIHLRDVSRQKPEEEIVETRESEEEKTLTSALSQRERENTEPRRLEMPGNVIVVRQIDDRMAFDRNVEPAQFRNNTSVGELRGASPDGFVPRKRRTGEESAAVSMPRQPTVATPAFARSSLDPDARYATSLPARRSESLASPSPPASGLSAETIARELDQIEVDLSLTVAQDRSQWNLPALKRRVESLAENGADPASRGRARLTLDKIKQFEDAFDSASPSGNSRSTSAASVSSEKSSSASGSLADPRYDTQGWLKEVVSRKGNKPAAPYAVVDSEGQPICFVSPTPGLNLHRYINKQVGLYGRRGYLEELKKPHVVAERVIELDSRLR